MSLQEGVRGVGGHFYVILLLATPGLSGLFSEHATTWVALSYLGRDQSLVRLPRYSLQKPSLPPKLSLKNQVRILPQNLDSPNSCESFSEQSPLGRRDRQGRRPLPQFSVLHIVCVVCPKVVSMVVHRGETEVILRFKVSY